MVAHGWGLCDCAIRLRRCAYTIRSYRMSGDTHNYGITAVVIASDSPVVFVRLAELQR